MKHTTHGFTLLELALVLTIASILLGGGLTILSTQTQARRAKETKAQLAEAREALIAYFTVNGYLPCPANQNLKIGDKGAENLGLETDRDSTTQCKNVVGVLPWATLGLKETDAWGHRFTYRVTRILTRISPLPSFVPPPRTGDMSIRMTTPVPPAPQTLASNVAAVVVSHGPNGNGGYNTQGVQATQPVSGANGNDERDNLISSPNTFFISNTPTEYFDDLLTWVTSDVLYSRSVMAGRIYEW